jgi:hypothetical protein
MRHSDWTAEEAAQVGETIHRLVEKEKLRRVRRGVYMLNKGVKK